MKTKTPTKAKKAKAPKKERLQREANVEFMLETEAQAKEVCAYLAQLETTMGWIFLVKMIKASMLVIERQIITKQDVDTGVKLTEEEVDALRMSYLAYEELINKPARLIANISQGNKPTSPEYDPYARGLKPSEENFAGVLSDEE